MLTIAVPLAARASVRSVSDDALARASAAAVEGRVVATAARWDAGAGAIYTYVTIDVARSWGLAGSPARVVVKQLGGLVADTALVVGGQAQFELGEDVLIFLDVRPRDGTLSVSGLEQGKWTLSGGDAATAANRQTRGHDPSVVVAREYRSAAYLNALASLAGTQVSAAGAVVEPVVPPAPAPPAGRSVAFTYLTSTPARWHQADTSSPVYVDSETGGHPQFAAGGLPQLQNALGAWSAGGSLRLQRGADRGPRCFSNSESDGHISIAYYDPCGEISNASSVLAIGGVYYSASDVRTVNGTAFWKIIKGMVVVDDNTSKYASFTTGCYEDMLVHEIGHAIGFGHTSARPAIMAPSLSSSCFGRSAGMALQSDDLAAVAAVYPGSGQPPSPPAPTVAPGTPTGLAASVVGGTVTLTWNAPSTGGSATGYQLYAGLAPGTSSFGPFPSPTTGLQATSVGSGVYYVRVVATNASGASAPTADLAVYVGMSPPPPAPMNLTATAAPGGVVTLAWQPPMTGTVTSYRLLAGHAPGATTYQIPVIGNSLNAGGVPSGTYYVRVVALNGSSVSPSCTEVTLVVP